MNTTFISFVTAAVLLVSNPAQIASPQPLAEVSYSLSNRNANSSVNKVFADNILLTLAYLGGKVKIGSEISWNTVKADGEVRFILKPGETFAFHDNVTDKFRNKISATTNAHFNSFDGYKSDGWLIGNGVCHLASFLYVAAKNAGLEVEAPTNHDFAVIPNIENKDGVSIFSQSAQQNLYITNNKSAPLAFVFIHTQEQVIIRIEQSN